MVDDVEEVCRGPSRRVRPLIREFRYPLGGEEPLASLIRQSRLTFCAFGCPVGNGFWREGREMGLAVVQVREYVVASTSVVGRGVDRFRICVKAELMRCEVGRERRKSKLRS